MFSCVHVILGGCGICVEKQSCRLINQHVNTRRDEVASSCFLSAELMGEENGQCCCLHPLHYISMCVLIHVGLIALGINFWVVGREKQGKSYQLPNSLHNVGGTIENGCSLEDSRSATLSKETVRKWQLKDQKWCMHMVSIGEISPHNDLKLP